MSSSNASAAKGCITRRSPYGIAALLCATLCAASSAPRLHAEPTAATNLSHARVVARGSATQVTNVNELLQQLSKISSLRARFREEKHMKLLKRPLFAEGVVYFTKPGWIARKTERPEPSMLLLRDGQLTVSDPSGKHVFDVSGSPVLRAFVEGFVHVLSGDRAALERDYQVSFEVQQSSAWRLTLRPKSAALMRFLAELSFVGKGATVERMSLRETSGDETQTEFSATEARAAFDPAERAHWFGTLAR